VSVLVTGGGGGIGSSVVRRLLDKGHEVVVYDIAPVREDNLVLRGQQGLSSEVGSVTDMARLTETIKRHNVTGVIHLAVMLPVYMNDLRPLEALNVNIVGTATVLEAARLFGLGPVITTSAAGVAGRPQDVSILRTEEDVTLPLSGIYPLSKLACEQLVYTYRTLHDVNTTAVRPRNGYGPGTAYRPQPLYDVIYDAFAGKDVIKERGGDSIFDYTYVKDLAKALCQLYELETRPPNYVYNLAWGVGVTMSDVCRAVQEVFPERRISVGPGPWEGVVEAGKEWEVTTYPAVMPLQDVSRAREDWGFAPDWPLERGIADWVRFLKTDDYGEF
jgi:UDP-glucose 4-epimerase